MPRPTSAYAIYLAYQEALPYWESIPSEPDLDISYQPEPTPEQEAEDAQEPTITIVMYS